jgi:hypothetical protein
VIALGGSSPYAFHFALLQGVVLPGGAFCGMDAPVGSDIALIPRYFGWVLMGLPLVKGLDYIYRLPAERE